MIKEYWKPVVGYEGLYMVSNWGRVKSIKFGKERILKQNIRRGYYYVGLSKNGIVKNYSVHRLVAEAFLDNSNNYPCINHKDECKTNNNVINLEWCTYKYNSNYGTAIQRTSQKRINGKCSKKVYQYTLDGQFVREWESIQECGRNGFNVACICMCCKGKQKTYKGYIWKYK